MIEILSKEAIEKVVEAAFEKDYLLEHYVATRGHWERIAPIIAEAQLEDDRKWIVKLLKGFEYPDTANPYYGDQPRAIAYRGGWLECLIKLRQELKKEVSK